MKDALLVIGAIIAVILISFGLWAAGVVLSGVIGQGNAIKIKNGTENRIEAQQQFEQLHADIFAADQRIDVMAAAAKATPGIVSSTNLNGAINQCITVRADYDAEARKYTAAQFRAADLPLSIDQLDPATDCKESHS